MAKMLIPIFDMADKYFLHSRKVYDLYKEYDDHYYYYVNTTERKKNTIGSVLVVTVFTQPDWYAERYYNFIKELCNRVKNSGIKVEVNIKPHYRQNNEDLFLNLSKEYAFCKCIDKMQSVNELLQKSNMIMSMTSSVLSEAVSVGTPGLIIDIDGRDSNIISTNDFAVEEVNFRCKSYEDVMMRLLYPESCIQEYSQRRKKFFEASNAITDITSVFN